MTSAHPNITVVDPSVRREDIARFYSERHAQVWELVQRAGLAAAARPPVFEAACAVVETTGRYLQTRGMRTIEPGWLQHAPLEQARLEGELPTAPAVIDDLGMEPVQISDATVHLAPPTPKQLRLDAGSLIELMRESGLGRPATYANHVKKVFEYVDQGVLNADADGKFTLDERGRELLELLSAPDLPVLDAEYSAALERDLEAIERGDVDAKAVVLRHLGRLPGVEVDPQHGRDNGTATSTRPPLASPVAAESSLAYQLPAEIDPALTLPQRHPLRRLRAAFDETDSHLFGPAMPNRRETTRRRACRMVAVGRICSDGTTEVLERLRRDLAWRWVIGLAPTDAVWTQEQVARVVAGQEELIEALATAGESRLGTSARLTL